VTGASGFIGAHLCRRLAECDATLHAVSRLPQYSKGERTRWWQADVSDPVAARDLVKSVQPHILFHLASHVVGARKLDAVLPTFHGNLASTVHLLTEAAEIGCRRVVLAGSSEEPQLLDDTTFPCSPYAAAKWAGSMYGRMFYQLFQLPIVMPRIFMTYGPNQKDNKKLIPFVLLHLLRGESPKLGSGLRRADWIYVDDVVEGLLRSAVIPGIEGRAFDLGSGSLTSVREIVKNLIEITGSAVDPLFGTLPDRPFEQERSADTSFMSNELGYYPRTSLKAGLESTVSWYREQLDARVDQARPPESVQ